MSAEKRLVPFYKLQDVNHELAKRNLWTEQVKHNISVINENINFHDQQGVTFSTLLKVMWDF